MSSKALGVSELANEYPDAAGGAGSDPVAYQPFVASETAMRELTFWPLLVGVLLGFVFGISSLYLVLKVGLTISTSIPIAAISIMLFRALSTLGWRDVSILENNIAQTAGSPCEAIAFGVGITMPAMMILGFDLDLAHLTAVTVIGAVLGALIMLPLRRAFIVERHGQLTYPEGTACAEVLKAGTTQEYGSRAWGREEEPLEAASGTGQRLRAGILIVGFVVSACYQGVMSLLKGWKEIPQKVFASPFKGASIEMEVSPALLGVGYIIGPRVASMMCAGGVMSYLVLVPLIKHFGEGQSYPIPPALVPINAMASWEVRNSYVLYIGAGAVGAAGIINLFRGLPLIWSGLNSGLSYIGRWRVNALHTPRTEREIPLAAAGVGILCVVACGFLYPRSHLGLLGALLVLILGILFVTVSARLTGEIGSSSNPISGITIAALLLTCILLLLLGWTDRASYAMALSVGAVVGIAAANGGTAAQTLKTGYLLGATPQKQQRVILVCSLLSALVIGPVLLSINDSGTVYISGTEFKRPESATEVRLATSVISELDPYTGELPYNSYGKYRRLDMSRLSAAPPNLEPGTYLVDEFSGKIAYKFQRNFPEGLHASQDQLGLAERLQGPQAAQDRQMYFAWHNYDPYAGWVGKYLCDQQGTPIYFVDPGINGFYNTRPDGTPVQKYFAPKAALMAYIINGILGQQLPWTLILVGVMITVLLEICGVPSLPFAVGLYLPLSSSSPILVGGIIRSLVERARREERIVQRQEDDPVAAEGTYAGVLLASGYVAGSAIVGVFIAFMFGFFDEAQRRLSEWARQSNPFYEGSYSDLLSLIPFALLVLLLYAGAREWSPRLKVRRKQWFTGYTEKS